MKGNESGWKWAKVDKINESDICGASLPFSVSQLLNLRHQYTNTSIPIYTNTPIFPLQVFHMAPRLSHLPLLFSCSRLPGRLSARFGGKLDPGEGGSFREILRMLLWQILPQLRPSDSYPTNCRAECAGFTGVGWEGGEDRKFANKTNIAKYCKNISGSVISMCLLDLSPLSQPPSVSSSRISGFGSSDFHQSII